MLPHVPWGENRVVSRTQHQREIATSNGTPLMIINQCPLLFHPQGEGLMEQIFFWRWKGLGIKANPFF
ncbi:MAG: hypothetical protein A2Z14_13455 [Chloroflexi bacterium RBG_16_48_8]|nr:MAG: hypothetical protein A2Z14_13455 [Chloroflexi bacterium RBG_16_48_8]